MELESEEFKRVVLEIVECLKQNAITPTMQKLVEQYEKELE